MKVTSKTTDFDNCFFYIAVNRTLKSEQNLKKTESLIDQDLDGVQKTFSIDQFSKGIKNGRRDKTENQCWKDSINKTHTLKINKLESRANQKKHKRKYNLKLTLGSVKA